MRAHFSFPSFRVGGRRFSRAKSGDGCNILCTASLRSSLLAFLWSRVSFSAARSLLRQQGEGRKGTWKTSSSQELDDCCGFLSTASFSSALLDEGGDSSLYLFTVIFWYANCVACRRKRIVFAPMRTLKLWRSVQRNFWQSLGRKTPTYGKFLQRKKVFSWSPCLNIRRCKS